MGIPVAHSLMGKGALPDDHPLVLGMTGFWGTKFINDKCLGADWMLGLGTRFKEADSSSWEPEYTFSFPPTKLIHIDIEPSEIGRNFPTEIGAVADLKQALKTLNRVAKEIYPKARRNEALEREIAKVRAEFKKSNKAMEESDDFPMMPERILAEVRAVLPRDAIITTDVGWNKNGVGQQFPIYTPGSVLTPGGYATMGFGPPAALGAKIAAPGQGGHLAGRRRRLRPEPVGAGDRGGRKSGGDLGGDEQQRLRHHRRPAESALRHDARHHVPQ